MSNRRVSESTVRCKNCELHLDSDLGVRSADQRVPCPQCGSTFRIFELQITASVVAEGHLGHRLRSPGKGKWKRQEHGGDSFFRKDGRWHKLVRILDRAKNWYYEHITDAKTGEVVRHIEEPLSEHKNKQRLLLSGCDKDTKSNDL